MVQLEINKKAEPQPSQLGTHPFQPEASVSTISAFSGPVPPPNILHQYEVLLPGISQKFLLQPILEAEHRRELEKNSLKERIKIVRRGQWMAYSLGLLTLVLALVALLIGSNVGAIGSLFFGIASFFSVFYSTRNKST